MSRKPGRALEAVLKLAALEERTAELKGSLERIESKLDGLVERIARVEAGYEQLSRGEDRAEAREPEAEIPSERLVGGLLKIGSEE
jgi:phage shock protein A